MTVSETGLFWMSGERENSTTHNSSAAREEDVVSSLGWWVAQPMSRLLVAKLHSG